MAQLSPNANDSYHPTPTSAISQRQRQLSANANDNRHRQHVAEFRAGDVLAHVHIAPHTLLASADFRFGTFKVGYITLVM